MFRRDSTADKPARLETIIGKDAEFKGTVSSPTGLRIDGRLEGLIANAGDVIVGEGAVVVGDINGRNIMVAGEVRGNVKAADRLEITRTGRVLGDISTSVLVIAEGGKLEGRSEMHSKESNET